MCSQKLFIVTDNLLTDDELNIIGSIANKSNTAINILALNNIPGQEKKYEGIVDNVLYSNYDTYQINQIKSWLTKYIIDIKPLVVFFKNSLICNILASFVAAKLETGIVVNCINIEYQDGDFLYSRTAMNSSSIAKIKFNCNNTQIVTVLSFMTKSKDVFYQNKKRKTIYFDISVDVLHDINNFESTVLYPDKYYSKNEIHAHNDICIDIGYGAKDILDDIINFADKIDAMIGASKKLVDFGLVDEKYLVGQSGKIISSRLCISIGTSGQVQHVVGIIQSKTIVAINIDSDAKIFNYCDFGVVCNAEHIIKELNYAISSLS